MHMQVGLLPHRSGRNGCVRVVPAPATKGARAREAMHWTPQVEQGKGETRRAGRGAQSASQTAAGRPRRVSPDTRWQPIIPSEVEGCPRQRVLVLCHQEVTSTSWRMLVE